MKFISLLRHWLHKKRNPEESVITQHAIIGNSIYKDLSLRLDNPMPGHIYLTIADDCVVAGDFIFESSEGKIEIGNHTYIGGSRFICRTKMIVGDNVNISWGCTITDHDSHNTNPTIRRKDLDISIDNIRNGRDAGFRKDWTVVKTAPIVIEDDAWIGMNCIILKGVTIGEGAIIGAASVVTKDVPAWHLAAGNPARIIRKIEH